MKNLLLIIILFFTSISVFAEQACYQVDGMTCSACGVTLKTAVKKVDGVKEVTTSVENKEATIIFDPDKTNTSEIKTSIDNIGYRATPKECQKT